jgi:hypothetical protein
MDSQKHIKHTCYISTHHNSLNTKSNYLHMNAERGLIREGHLCCKATYFVPLEGVLHYCWSRGHLKYEENNTTERLELIYSPGYGGVLSAGLILP